jgi:cobalamin biosynthetic protein CobC
LVGHSVHEVGDVAQLNDADVAVVVNPNNPDGRIVKVHQLLDLADALSCRGGLLVVDEAFMDAGPLGATLCGDVADRNIVVLRSFGKFFGLAGVRLGFAITAPALATRLAALLGPWAVSGPAIAAGATALADVRWIEAMRDRLAADAWRLDALLIAQGMEVIGGTTLFRLVNVDPAERLFRHLGSAGILVRRFPEQPTRLRFGLPGREDAWDRLTAALARYG